MGLTIVDGRPEKYKGDLDFAILKDIINNSLYNTTYSDWYKENKTVTITNGAHDGSFYPEYETNYYFDVVVSGDARTWHSLLKKPAGKNSSVLANV
ncbi:MAG: hypothetical protein WBB25_05210 [Sulfitobacter sp.]